MPASGGVSKPSQRSSSSTRSSRRATLSVGPGGSLSNGSLSPQRVLRTKVLRERSNEGSGYLSSDTNASVGVKAKPVSKGATRAQHMQFAFGSKIVKPGSTKAGVSGVAGEARGRNQGGVIRGGAVADGGSNAPIRSRRERASMHDPHEQQQRVTPRGRSATHAQHQRLPLASTREEMGADTLKAELAEKDKVIASLRHKLENDSAEAMDVSGSKDSHGARLAATPFKVELDEGAQAALLAVEEEARAEAEEALKQVETVAAATLSKTKELQASVDEMIQILKNRRR